MIFISEGEILGLVSVKDAIRAVEEIMELQAEGKAHMTPRTRTVSGASVLNTMSASSEALGLAGLKAYMTVPGSRGIRHVMLLYSQKSGDLLAIIEADAMSRLRTGAASAATSKRLAKRGVSRISVIGAGRIGWPHALAIHAVFEGSEVLVNSRTPAKAVAMASELRRRGIRARAVESYEEACRADVISTATDSREPFLLGSWISRGSHVNLAGSNRLDRAEARPDLFRIASLVVVDSKEQALVESGDLSAAVKDGVLSWESIRELWEVFKGLAARREDSEVTVFKSHGIALWDLALARVVYERALKRGLGKEISISEGLGDYPDFALG